MSENEEELTAQVCDVCNKGVVVLNETNRWSDFRSYLLRCCPHVICVSSASTYEADAVISPFKNKVWGVNKSLKSKVDNDK